MPAVAFGESAGRIEKCVAAGVGDADDAAVPDDQFVCVDKACRIKSCGLPVLGQSATVKRYLDRLAL